MKEKFEDEKRPIKNSKTNNLIQADDYVAYVYTRSIRSASLDMRLRENLRALQKNANNLSIVTDKWGSET